MPFSLSACARISRRTGESRSPPAKATRERLRRTSTTMSFRKFGVSLFNENRETIVSYLSLNFLQNQVRTVWVQPVSSLHEGASLYNLRGTVLSSGGESLKYKERGRVYR